MPMIKVDLKETMACDKCRRPAIVYQRYSGLHLCESHFNEDFEKKAKREIRKRQWIRPGDRIGIIMNGGMDSNGLAFFLSHLLNKRHDIDLIGLSVVDGPVSDQSATRAEEVARNLEIPWVSVSLSKEIRCPIDKMAMKKSYLLSCPLNNVLINHCLELPARDQGVTKIALSKDLDEEAGDILMRTLQGSPSRLFDISAGAGCQFQQIWPFISIPKREVMLYAFLHPNGNEFEKHLCSPSRVPEEIRALLNEYAYRHPATKYALVNLAEELRSSPLLRSEASCIVASGKEPGFNRCEICDMLNKVRHGN
jgi:tRNA(Ile)-lysidine synthase TilS/MesJ